MVDAHTALQIARLKVKAREKLRRFNAIAEHYDCGNSMLKTVSLDAASAARDFNDAMTELRRLDPNCPEFTPL